MNIYLRYITKIHKNPYPPPQLQTFSKFLKNPSNHQRVTQIQAYWCERMLGARPRTRRAAKRPKGALLRSKIKRGYGPGMPRPGGPPSGMEWSAFAKQNKKRSLFLCWTRVRLPPAHKRKRPNPGRLLWSWRESNPRPNRETICFLQAYLYLSFRAMTWIELPGHNLIF